MVEVSKLPDGVDIQVDFIVVVEREFSRNLGRAWILLWSSSSLVRESVGYVGYLRNLDDGVVIAGICGTNIGLMLINAFLVKDLNKTENNVLRTAAQANRKLGSDRLTA
jgi:hypothetical protein